MAKQIYVICPVRNRTREDQEFADAYVANLEAEGNSVHYPPRDVDQADDGIGFGISDAHRTFMRTCDEVHVIWDPESVGSHFDFGMAFMLQAFKDTHIVLARPVSKTSARSYGNMLSMLSRNAVSNSTD
jgi:hypothetical protein